MRSMIVPKEAVPTLESDGCIMDYHSQLSIILQVGVHFLVFKKLKIVLSAIAPVKEKAWKYTL